MEGEGDSDKTTQRILSIMVNFMDGEVGRSHTRSIHACTVCILNGLHRVLR